MRCCKEIRRDVSLDGQCPGKADPTRKRQCPTGRLPRAGELSMRRDAMCQEGDGILAGNRKRSRVHAGDDGGAACFEKSSRFAGSSRRPS
jgi:hypothetical protein